MKLDKKGVRLEIRVPQGRQQNVMGIFGIDLQKTLDAMSCIDKPIGCGQPVTVESFKDPLSLKEYGISGLCQACQNKIFGS